MTIAGAPLVERRSGRAAEHRFFQGMSLLIALVVFIGFAPTYYLSGWFHARPLPAPIVHVHGAVFTAWIALLVVQTSLVEGGRTDLHRRLGLIGLGLAPLLVIRNVLVGDEMLNRLARAPGVDWKLIFAVAMSEISAFAVPVFFAFRLRRKPAFHKRLIVIGTIAMTTAGFGRWHLHVLAHKPLPAMLAAFSLLALVFAYDLLSTRRLHPATIWGSAWVVFIEAGWFAFGHTAAWHAFAAQLQSISR
jgi:hypothetical protein